MSLQTVQQVNSGCLQEAMKKNPGRHSPPLSRPLGHPSLQDLPALLAVFHTIDPDHCENF